MSPLTWALKEVDPVGLHRQPGIHAQENRSDMYTTSAKHFFGRKMPPPLANGTLCLSNGKSTTVNDGVVQSFWFFNFSLILCYTCVICFSAGCVLFKQLHLNVYLTIIIENKL
jgi:hypothetical protein